MLFPVTAKSASGTMSPAFNSLQNLSDKDRKLTFSITQIPVDPFSHSPSSSNDMRIKQLLIIFCSLPPVIFKQDGANRTFGERPSHNSWWPFSALPRTWYLCRRSFRWWTLWPPPQQTELEGGVGLSLFHSCALYCGREYQVLITVR